jgi:putative ABC transport system permease protein
MKAQDVFSYAFSAIKLRKLRAGLTTLGVIIGIAAIVALLSLGQGFQDAITAQFQKGFATNTLNVSPRSFGLAESSFQLFMNDTQTIDKIGNVSTSVALIQKTVYVNSTKGTFLVNVVGVDFNSYGNIYGSTFVAENGSIPSNTDNESIVIGARIRNPWQNGTLLADVGDSIEIIWTNRTSSGIENKTYVGHVSAVLKEVGGFSLGGPADLGVYIPISQAESFFGTDECNTIIVQLQNSDDSTIQNVSDAIKNAFNNQVSVTSSTAILDTISSVFSIVELFLAGIGGISLLVAGIGIMNIMIVSLMERTREIGILKALGMKGRTVLLIFLSEAIIIGFMGAVFGVGLGWGLANVFARFGFTGAGLGQGQANQTGTAVAMRISPVLTPTLFLGAIAFGITVSVVFALYPAWRASKLKPVEALRYE